MKVLRRSTKIILSSRSMSYSKWRRKDCFYWESIRLRLRSKKRWKVSRIYSRPRRRIWPIEMNSWSDRYVFSRVNWARCVMKYRTARSRCRESRRRLHLQSRKLTVDDQRWVLLALLKKLHILSSIEEQLIMTLNHSLVKHLPRLPPLNVRVVRLRDAIARLNRCWWNKTQPIDPSSMTIRFWRTSSSM